MTRTALAALLVGAAALSAQEGPKPKTAYQKFVLVPYFQAFDEVLAKDLESGRFPAAELPPWLRYNGGKVEHAEPQPTGGYGDWKPVSPSMVARGFALYGRDKCIYDNESNYLLLESVYDRYKDRLIPKHQGRVEHFALPGEGLKPDGKGALVFDLNLTKYETYVWDATDQCWRYPVTLTRVEAGVKLKDGGKPLTDHTPKQKGLPTGVLEDILRKFEEQYAKDRAKLKKD